MVSLPCRDRAGRYQRGHSAQPLEGSGGDTEAAGRSGDEWGRGLWPKVTEERLSETGLAAKRLSSARG